MPVMNGIDSTKGICKLQDQFYGDPNVPENKKKILPRAPIIAMTAFSNKKTVAECKDAGMMGVLYKPCNRKAFEDQVCKTLNVEFLK